MRPAGPKEGMLKPRRRFRRHENGECNGSVAREMQIPPLRCGMTNKEGAVVLNESFPRRRVAGRHRQESGEKDRQEEEPRSVPRSKLRNKEGSWLTPSCNACWTTPMSQCKAVEGLPAVAVSTLRRCDWVFPVKVMGARRHDDERYASLTWRANPHLRVSLGYLCGVIAYLPQARHSHVPHELGHRGRMQRTRTCRSSTTWCGSRRATSHTSDGSLARPMCG